MKAVLHVEGLTVRFGGHVALREVGFELEPGARLAVIGDNGAGKTTLLDAIGGQILPSGGAVHLDGRDLTRLPPHRRARLGLARTFQHLGLVPSLTAAENISLALDRGEPQRRGKDGGSRTARAYTLLANAGLAHRVSALGSSLSPSEGKTVALLRALAARPRVLLLDEPGAGLDPEGKARLLAHLDGLDWAPAVVLVEHDLDLVARFAPRALRLEAGEAAVELSTATLTAARPAPPRAPSSGRAATPDAAEAPAALLVGRLSMTQFGLRSVDLELAPGEIVSLIGAAGAGKSALAAAIAGTHGYLGEIRLRGTRLGPGRPDARARAGLRVLAAPRAHFGQLTVAENLELGAWGLPRAERGARRAAAQASFPILSRRAQAPAEVLSGGERQLLAVARATMQPPKVLVLDEPTAGLSSGPIGELGASLRALADAGCAILLMEQAPRAAATLPTSRQLYLRDGRVETS